MTRITVLSMRGIGHPLIGGAGGYIHEIFRRLATRYEVTVLSDRGTNTDTVEEIDGIIYKSFPGRFHRILLPARYLSKFAGKTDLLIDNSDVGIPWLTPFYTRIPKLAVIYQVAQTILRYELASPFSDIAMRLEPFVYKLYRDDKVVTCSPSTKRDLVRLGLNAERITVIRPGIDESLRKFEADGRKFEDPTIVCISRFNRYKGLSFAVKSMGYVLSKVPKARLIIAGNGDETELKEDVSRTSYPKAIQITKRSPNTWNVEKQSLLSKSHILLIPSVREGYGMVVIEANACGTPAIGWDVPGVCDSIINGKTGLLVPFGDTSALAKTIVSCLSGERRNIVEMSKGAIDWARQHSWDDAAEKFDEVISETLAQ